MKTLFLQKAAASYDLNGDDPDPSPRYDPTNENKYEINSATRLTPYRLTQFAALVELNFIPKTDYKKNFHTPFNSILDYIKNW